MKKLLLSLAFLVFTGLAHGQCGPPNYACSYSGVDIKNWPATVHSFGVQQNNFTTYFDTTLLPANPSAVIRCTDQLLEVNTITGSTIANQSKSGGLGGSGESKWLFNSNSTLVHYNTSSGQGHITLFDPTIPKCGDPITGHAITADKNLTNPGSASVVYNFGNGTFDTTDAGCTAGHSCYYSTSNGSDNTSNTVIVKYVISQTDGTFTVTNPYIDMVFGFPFGVQAPAYQTSHGYSIGDYVQVTLSLSNWDNTTAWVLGDVIFPTTNNPGNCAFKLVTVGTRGSQPNPWSAAGSCVNSQNKVEGSGSETWKNIGHNGTFVFQATAGGTSSAPGSTPSFGTSTTHPDIGSLITDNTVTWVNSGGLISPTWQAFGNASSDSTRFCFAYSNNTYGHPGAYTNDNGGQGSGFYTECYNSTTNKFVLLNTVTGVQDTTTCSTGTGYNCSGGTLSKLTGQGAALAAVASGCAFNIHGDKGGSTQDFNVISVQGKISGSCPTIASGTGLLMDWQPFATFNTTTTLQAYNTASGHFSIGKSKLVNFNNSSLNFGFDSGANNIILDSNTPTGAAVTSWQFGAPFTAACEPHTSWFWGDPVPPCRYVDIYDSHTVIWNDGPDDDLGPACGTFYDAQTGHATPGAPGIGEVMCVSTTPTWTVPGTIGAYKLSRFTHTYCMMTNVFFDVQFCVGQLSPDGKWFAFSSDWNCSFGDTLGVATNLCGPPWSPNTAYPINTLINPFQFLTGSGTNYGVYKVTAVGSGTSAPTAPAWFTCSFSAGTIGNTVTDSHGMQYTCQGAGNAKGELMIVSLAPTPGVNSPTVLTPFIVPLGY